jgi:nucleoside-diphosphate-sugar epimerase
MGLATYLVTGGAGFIGTNIVRELVGRGEQVRVLDDLSTGKMENLAGLTEQIDFIQGSITDMETVTRSVAGADYVLHQAALASVQRSVDNPLETDQVNVRGTLNMLIAARNAGVKRFVFASSSSIYGESEELPKRENMPSAPISPYGVSKLAGEAYCLAFHAAYNMPTVALRYFNVFGPRQDPKSHYAAVIPLFATALIRGQAPTIFGDGLQSRDFSYVSNVVDANLLACQAPGAAGQIFNIACNRQHSLLELLDVLKGLVGSQLEAVFEPARAGDIRHSLADTSKARHLLGYDPGVGFHEGLVRTVLWYQEQQAGV